MAENLNGYGIVLITTGSQQEAETIASALVEAKLAACVSLTPIRSIYTWHNQVHSDSEWQLMIKTNLELFSNLEAKIRELHSYEVPEVIAIPLVAGSPAYLNWIAETLHKPQ